MLRQETSYIKKSFKPSFNRNLFQLWLKNDYILRDFNSVIPYCYHYSRCSADKNTVYASKRQGKTLAIQKLGEYKI